MLKTYAVHFCGAGGACLGIHRAGLECRLAIDFFQAALDTRERNLRHKGTCVDIFQHVNEEAHAADLLWTSPVCQTYSTASRSENVKREALNDVRNDLYLPSVEYVKRFKPKYFVLENVEGLLTHGADKKGNGTFTRIRGAFRDAGYHTEWSVLDSKDFGLAQTRRRVFIVGSLEGKRGLIPVEPGLAGAYWQIAERNVHEKAWCAQTYQTAMSKIERGKGSMRVITGNDEIFPTVTCAWGGGPTRKKVCIADTTNADIGAVPFLRNPTVREGSRAQGFPDDWEWPENESNAWKMIGNAVSPPVAEAIVRHLVRIEDGGRPPAKSEISVGEHMSKVPKWLREADFDDYMPEMAFEEDGDAS